MQDQPNDVDELLARADLMHGTRRTSEELATELSEALDEFERKFADGCPRPGADSRIEYAILSSRIFCCRIELERLSDEWDDFLADIEDA